LKKDYLNCFKWNKLFLINNVFLCVIYF
jgi:hypothetical protein